RNPAHRRQCDLLPVLAVRSTSARHRGNRRSDPDFRFADRSLSGPGIPELAPALRALIAGAALAVALASVSALAGPATTRSPSWRELSTTDQQVLAPLSAEWDKLDTSRKQKWLGIARRYPTMQPAERERIQQQMRTWTQLTPA